MTLVLFGFVLFGVVLSNECGQFNCNRTEHCCNIGYSNVACFPLTSRCHSAVICDADREYGNCCNPGCSNSYYCLDACPSHERAACVRCGQKICNGGEVCCNPNTGHATCVLATESCPSVACTNDTDCGTNGYCCNPGCLNSRCMNGTAFCPQASDDECPYRCGSAVCGLNQFCCNKGYLNQQCIGNNEFCSVPINCTATAGCGEAQYCCNPGCSNSYCLGRGAMCMAPRETQRCPVPCGNITCPYGNKCCNGNCANPSCSPSNICSDACQAFPPSSP